MKCLLCGLPTGQPKDSYGFTMPNVGNGLPARFRFVRVHKDCLRAQGRTRAERFAKVVAAYRERKTAAVAG